MQIPDQQRPDQPKRPLQHLELVCIIVAAMPGIFMFTSGPAESDTQAFYRLSLFLAGSLGFVAVKVYQHLKTR